MIPKSSLEKNNILKSRVPAPVESLMDDFVLCNSSNMVFHWADYVHTCEKVKNEIFCNGQLMNNFHLKEKAIDRLNFIPIWIKAKNQIIQTNMHQLYEKFILSGTHFYGSLDPFLPIEISFISSSGPFKLVSIAECFNKSTYKDFVMVYLLQDKLPKRDFRIRLKSKILMEYGKSFSNVQLVSLEQMALNGLLLSLDSDFYFRRVQKNNTVRVLIHLDMLYEAQDLNLSELKKCLNRYTFNLMYSSLKEHALEINVKDMSLSFSFDYALTKRIFLFVPYDKMTSPYFKDINVIKSFVMNTQKIICQHFEVSKINQNIA